MTLLNGGIPAWDNSAIEWRLELGRAAGPIRSREPYEKKREGRAGA